MMASESLRKVPEFLKIKKRLAILLETRRSKTAMQSGIICRLVRGFRKQQVGEDMRNLLLIATVV